MTVEERLAALEQAWAALQAQTPTSYYTSRHGGEEIDKGIDRAKEGGAIDAALAGKANQTDLWHLNLLENWYFADPINQRNQQSYTNGYGIDRWALSGNGGQRITLENDGVLLTSTALYGSYFDRVFDPNYVAQLAGKTICFSALWGPDTGARASLNIYINGQWTNYAEHTAGGLASKTVTVPVDATSIRLSFGSNGAGTSKIKAAKLELGTQQTLAHQDAAGNWVLNDPPPNKALELAKCQRYQFAPVSGGNDYSVVADAYNASNTNEYVQFVVDLPNMRTVPTVTWSGAWALLRQGSSSAAVTNMYVQVSQSSPCKALLHVESATPLPEGRYFLRRDGSTDAMLIFDANL